MKRMIAYILLGVALLSPQRAVAQTLSAQEILSESDDVFNAPPDQYWEMKVIVTDRLGRRKVRESVMYQKGDDMRLTRFTAPADQKGIGFLSLPNDVMYLYLPAFQKTRRIASHIKNSKFAGTDFTYEDMEAKRDADKWNATLVSEDEIYYVIDMKLKSGKTSEYSKMMKWVRKDNFFPTRLEMYDKGGALCKVLIREKIEQVDGYWTCKEYEMKDVKENHSTRMVLTNIKFNQKLKDELFTERFLAK